MSAHVVSQPNIDVLVHAAETIAQSGDAQTMAWWIPDENGRYTAWRVLWPSRMGGQSQVMSGELGQMLWDENVRSVRHRYPDDYALPGDTDMPWIIPYKQQPVPFKLTPGEVFQTIDYYSYQTCEHPGWEVSEAFSFCRHLRGLWCKRVPGYAETPWGWEHGDIARRAQITRTLTLDDKARAASRLG